MIGNPVGAFPVGGLFNLTQPVENIVNIQWNSTNSVEVSSTISWDSMSAVLASSAMRWDLLNSIEVSTDITWNLANTVLVSDDLLWDLRNSVLAASNIQWSVQGSVVTTEDVQWNTLNSVEISDDINWSVAGDAKDVVDVTFDFTGAIRVPLLTTELSGPPLDPVEIVISGTALDGLSVTDILNGGETIHLTADNDTWVSGAAFAIQREGIFDGIVSAGNEASGFNNLAGALSSAVKEAAVVRSSDSEVIITLPAITGFDLVSSEVLTVTVPAAALVTETANVIATPTLFILPNLSHQLAVGHFVPWRIPMEITHPIDDTVRSTLGGDSRYYHAYPGKEYRAPILVLGGSYPFLYEITARSGTATNLASAVIGQTRQYGVGREYLETEDCKEYGMLRWTPEPSEDGATFSFTVRVTGQDGAPKSVTFSGSVNAGKFIFIQDDHPGSRDGTIDNPFEDNTEWWVDGFNDDHQGKIACYMDNYNGGRGYYSAFPSRVFKPIKPMIFIGDPDNSDYWELDGEAKQYNFNSLPMHDFWWSDCYINGSPGGADGYNDCRFFQLGTNVTQADRPMFYNNYFYNGKMGLKGNDNDGWIVVLDSGAKRSHLGILGCVFDTANGSPPRPGENSNGFNVVTCFNCERQVFEHNIVRNFQSETTVQLGKDNTNNWSMRANDLWFNNKNRISIRNQDRRGRSYSQEVCWNWLHVSNDEVIYWNSQRKEDVPGMLYLYKNTIASEGATAGFAMSVFNQADPTEQLFVSQNATVSLTSANMASQLSTGGSTDQQLNDWLGGTYFVDNAHYQTAANDAIDMDTGSFKNTASGNAARGWYGAMIL